MRKFKVTAAFIAFSAALGTGPSWSADAGKVNWSSVPRSEITLFYPGQASYQFVTSGKHPGAGALAGGVTCITCHKGKEAELGNKIVAGNQFEPKPVTGKRGTINVTVQAAYDNQNIYLKIFWPAKEAGAFHEYAVYRDGKWQNYATNKNNAAVAAGKMKASYEDRFTIMLGDGRSVPAFNTQGCWATCHNDMRYMPNEAKKDDVEAHPILGKSGMKKSDIRKYIAESRTAMGPGGGWDKIKSREEIDALRAKGVFLELWQWRGFRSNPVGAADDGYVLDYREFDAGKNPFFNNWDGVKNEPIFMFDPAQNGGRAGLAEAQFRNSKAPLLTPKNRVPYDPKFKWRNGDLMTKQGLQPPEGSAGDNAVVGTFGNGGWTLVWTRKLNTGNKDDIVLKSGESYPIGLAVHDDNVTARFHHVSFPLKLTLGGKDPAAVNAVPLR
jgi:VCBS repeat-containing protein